MRRTLFNISSERNSLNALLRQLSAELKIAESIERDICSGKEPHAITPGRSSFQIRKDIGNLWGSHAKLDREEMILKMEKFNTWIP